MKKIPFTYYGDLLGVSNFYKIDPETAHRKLDFFYNQTYQVLFPLSEKKNYDLKVYLFSDSLFITGSLFEETLKHLSYLYSILFQHNLLLRGAVVGGLLEFDPRVELKNMVKQLPNSDVLFRAVELEKRNRGARLLMEKKLAQKLLPKNWYTKEGYYSDWKNPAIPADSILRKIRISPNWNTYEYLWPLIDIESFNGFRLRYPYVDYLQKIKQIGQIVPSEAAQNIKDTKRLIEEIKPELSGFIGSYLRMRSKKSKSN